MESFMREVPYYEFSKYLTSQNLLHHKTYNTFENLMARGSLAL